MLNGCRKWYYALAVALLLTPSQLGALSVAPTVLALSFDINLSPVRTESIPGWRLCYFVAATMGVISAAVSAACIWEPRNTRGGGAARAESAAQAAPWTAERLISFSRRSGGNVLAVARTPTFLIILVENISNLTRATGGYQVLYMMSLGFSPAATASMAVASTVGSALGFIAGGAVGDWTSRRWPNVSRPLANQVCLALTIPLVVLVLKGMPESSARATGWPASADSWAWAYGLLLFIISLLGSWLYANNLAMYALWAAAAAASVRNAAALENAMMQVILAATASKLVVYTGLYWALPRDRLEGSTAEPQTLVAGAAPTASAAPFLSSCDTGALEPADGRAPLIGGGAPGEDGAPVASSASV
ncbi:hypothetical protein WJX81_003541 [Elliptochloris bilobata]|uniref:Uncharacterized protein n=1 Tax=Elliptochloris bilobata TaxID=381761 RepID=A0AAW1S894_9CHLO